MEEEVRRPTETQYKINQDDFELWRMEATVLSSQIKI